MASSLSARRRSSADRIQTQFDPSCKAQLLRAWEWVEQASVHVAVQAFQVGAARVAEPAGHLDREPNGFDDALASDCLATERAARKLIGIVEVKVVCFGVHPGDYVCRSGMHKLGERRDREKLCLDDDVGEGRPREPVDPGDQPDRQLERREKLATIEKAIAALPEAFRTIIVLRDVQGMAYEEMAEVLACSIGTVKSRLARARGRVRAQLMMVHDEL